MKTRTLSGHLVLEETDLFIIDTNHNTEKFSFSVFFLSVSNKNASLHLKHITKASGSIPESEGIIIQRKEKKYNL